MKNLIFILSGTFLFGCTHVVSLRNSVEELAILETHTGEWQGTKKLWLSPGTDPSVCSTTLQVFFRAEDNVSRIEYAWSYNGKPQKGEMDFRQLESGGVEMRWKDTFHTPDETMVCPGDVKDGAIEVLGHYGADDQPKWGWRTVIDVSQPDHLSITMVNITPTGQEGLAVEFTLAR